MITITQALDGTFRWRISPDDMWISGYETYQAAFDAASIALAWYKR